MDPTDPRRTGTRRVRLVTAAVAGGALVGTGVLTVAVADAHPAAAGTTSSTEVSTGTSSTAGDSRPGGPAGGVGSSLGGRPHGSSGSS